MYFNYLYFNYFTTLITVNYILALFHSNSRINQILPQVIHILRFFS